MALSIETYANSAQLSCSWGFAILITNYSGLKADAVHWPVRHVKQKSVLYS